MKSPSAAPSPSPKSKVLFLIRKLWDKMSQKLGYLQITFPLVIPESSPEVFVRCLTHSIYIVLWRDSYNGKGSIYKRWLFEDRLTSCDVTLGFLESDEITVLPSPGDPRCRVPCRLALQSGVVTLVQRQVWRRLIVQYVRGNCNTSRYRAWEVLHNRSAPQV